MRSTYLVALALPVALSGCVSFTTLVKVKPDGSGTIVQTTKMSAEMAKQMEEMKKAFQSPDAKAEPAELFSEKDARAAASRMGDGVTFVKAERIKDASAEGLRAIYAFTDVTKIRLSQAPQGGGPGGAPGAKSDGADAVLFKLDRKGATSVLTAMFPKPKPSEGGKAKAAATKGDRGSKDGKPDPQALAQMKEMFKDMKFAMAVEVDGKLVKTSSPYVEGQVVTLMEMDFGQLLDNEKALESLAGDSQPSLEEAKELLKGLKGIKVNLEPEVTIEMAGS